MKDSFAALFFAVEVLAAQVNNHTRDGRGARTSARQALEKNHIKPPSTLGSSRNRKGKKKKP